MPSRTSSKVHGGISCAQSAQILRRRDGGRRRELRHRAGRMLRAARPQRRRQDHYLEAVPRPHRSRRRLGRADAAPRARRSPARPRARGSGAADGQPRSRFHRRRKPARLRPLLRSLRARHPRTHPRVARFRGPDRARQIANPDALGRNEAAPDARARAHQRSRPDLHGRTHHGGRSAGTPSHLGTAETTACSGENHRAHHAFHGGGRTPVRAPGHHGPRALHHGGEPPRADPPPYRAARDGSARRRRRALGRWGSREAGIAPGEKRRHRVLLRGRSGSLARQSREPRGTALPAPSRQPRRRVPETHRQGAARLMHIFAPPSMSLRFVPVWRRNLLVWRKLAIPSILGNLADPLIYVLGLGYGLGSMLPEVGGVPYIAFLAAGMVCSSTMNSATFESMYSAFSRMHVQRTWDAIMNAPVDLDDVVLAELAWSASKSVLSGVAILAVVWLLGLSGSVLSLWVIALLPLIGLTFGALALAVTAMARSYDFFMYYFTLLITPMNLLCGVFFPVEQLPAAFRAIAAFLPLTHAVAIARPLLLGQIPSNAVLHALVLLAYATAGFYAATVLFRRRLLK